MDRLIASTALLVLDEEGNSVNASEIEKWHMSGSNSLSSYNVSATHTMYVYVRQALDPASFLNLEYGR